MHAHGTQNFVADTALCPFCITGTNRIIYRNKLVTCQHIDYCYNSNLTHQTPQQVTGTQPTHHLQNQETDNSSRN